MEDLWFNQNALFTKWITTSSGLHEQFVIVDVGVQGDANARWELLGDYLVIYGFDPIEEVIAQLTRSNANRPNRHYYNFAIGDTDQTVTFYFNAANPTASSMYSQGPTRFNRTSMEHAREVPMRRLDTLFADGTISRPDFLKVDVEGFEKNVFAGARELLSKDILLAIESETNFGISPTYPMSHFSTLSNMLVQHCFIVFDIAFNRVPRATFLQALAHKDIAPPSVIEFGKPATLNVLYGRDPIDECDAPHHYMKKPTPVTIDQLIKMMIVFELYGLNDIAVDTAVRFKEMLGKRMDVERAIALLANAECRPTAEYQFAEDPARRVQELERRVRAMENSRSWRMTASLRKLRGSLRGIVSPR